MYECIEKLLVSNFRKSALPEKLDDLICKCGGKEVDVAGSHRIPVYLKYSVVEAEGNTAY